MAKTFRFAVVLDDSGPLRGRVLGEFDYRSDARIAAKEGLIEYKGYGLFVIDRVDGHDDAYGPDGFVAEQA